MREASTAHAISSGASHTGRPIDSTRADVARHAQPSFDDQRLRLTLDSITDGILMLDREWRFTYLNAAAEAVLIRKREELLGKVIWDEYQDATQLAFHREYNRAVDTQAPVTFEEFYPPLNKWIEARAFPSDDGLAVYFRDITSERAVRQALIDSETRFQLAAKATNELLWDWDAAEDILWCSGGLAQQFGWIQSEMHPGLEAWLDQLHPEERQDVSSSFMRAVELREEKWRHEYRFRRSDGSYAHVFDRAFIQLNPDGTVRRMVGAMIDITDLKAAEQKLREQASLLDKASDAIVVRDLEYRIQFWNKSAERLYGWRAEEVVGSANKGLLYKDPTDALNAAAEVLRSGEWNGELRQVDRWGNEVIVNARLSLVRDAEGKPQSILAISRDIRKRLEFERRLHQMQRIEALGQLTGGIAHDFNNLLTIVLGNSGMLEEALSGQAELQQFARLNRLAAERGTELVKQLLAFARRQSLDPRPTCIVYLLNGMRALLENALGKSVDLCIEAAPDVERANVDPVQLESAILNLAINARDAMPCGGRLAIRLANIDMPAPVHPDGPGPGAYVCICVTDTGIGIPPDILPRVCEPFFTTKPLGKGSGLGLSMVYGFARQSGGHLRISSETGAGTTVELLLPRTTDEGEHAGASDSDLPRGTERVLLVENDYLVRTYVAKQLELLGYSVVQAGDGEDAIEQLQSDATIQLLMTDISLPGGFEGQRLAARARSRIADLPIVLMSGAPDSSTNGTHLHAPAPTFLSKPFSRSALAKAVRAALMSTRIGVQ